MVNKTESDMTIAQTILSQIKTIDPMAMPAWGAKDLMDMGDGLKFKSTGMCRWKGQVYVRYNRGADAYDIEFFRVRAGTVKVDKVVNDVYAPELVSVIDAQVG